MTVSTDVSMTVSTDVSITLSTDVSMTGCIRSGGKLTTARQAERMIPSIMRALPPLGLFVALGPIANPRRRGVIFLHTMDDVTTLIIEEDESNISQLLKSCVWLGHVRAPLSVHSPDVPIKTLGPGTELDQAEVMPPCFK
ncbi:hypothetical protein [Arthrobacter globiformis]|uniref:hypothetical protein n=1 Tax=Arthrobacter globiformis TaxID=1665 RepID=UPI0027D83935|nr:hypothetical protein [Arthrobacter globiformis]